MRSISRPAASTPVCGSSGTAHMTASSSRWRPWADRGSGPIVHGGPIRSTVPWFQVYDPTMIHEDNLHSATSCDYGSDLRPPARRIAARWANIGQERVMTAEVREGFSHGA